MIESPKERYCPIDGLISGLLLDWARQSLTVDCPHMAESGSSNRWIFSGTKDRYTSEAAIHILVAENSVRTSASPPIAALELLVF